VSEVFEKVYKIVQRIPEGRVLTYGLISNLLEGRLSAQGVGWALNGLSSRGEPSKSGGKKQFNSENVPWQRVINSRGYTSTHKRPEMPPDLQRQLLEKEGVVFDDDGKCDLSKYLWDMES